MYQIIKPLYTFNIFFYDGTHTQYHQELLAFKRDLKGRRKKIVNRLTSANLLY